MLQNALVCHKERTYRIVGVLVYVTYRYIVVAIDIDPLQSVVIVRRCDI